jgi:hypothetical protein
LRALLSARSRSDLATTAVGRVAFTDDGSTLYVHLLPRPEWIGERSGQAFVLAAADKDELPRLSGMRALVHEAELLLHDEIDHIVRWLDEARPGRGTVLR